MPLLSNYIHFIWTGVWCQVCMNCWCFHSDVYQTHRTRPPCHVTKLVASLLLYASWIMPLSSIQSTRNRNSEVHERFGETIFVTCNCWLDETVPNPVRRWTVYGVGSAHNQTLHVPNCLTFVIMTKVPWLQEGKATSAGFRSSKALSSPLHPMFALNYAHALLRFGRSRRKGLEGETCCGEGLHKVMHNISVLGIVIVPHLRNWDYIPLKAPGYQNYWKTAGTYSLAWAHAIRREGITSYKHTSCPSNVKTFDIL